MNNDSLKPGYCWYKLKRGWHLSYRFIVAAVAMLVLLSLAAIPLKAQLYKNTQEVWPSIDAYLRLNPKLRLYSTLGGTKMNGSSYTDGGAGLYVDYFTFPITRFFRPNHADSLPGKFLWLRAGYHYSTTPPSAEDPFKENMLVTEANARYYLPLGMLLTWKNRFDWRFNNGEFKSRYRPRILVERDLHTDYLFFTASGFVEYFANFGSSDVNRFKTQLGVEVRVTKRMNYEVFWNHQFEHQPEVQSVDAFGMTLKVYLDKQDFKKKKKKSGKMEGAQ